MIRPDFIQFILFFRRIGWRIGPFQVQFASFLDSWQRKQASPAWKIFFPAGLSSADHACALNPQKPVRSFLCVWHRFAYSRPCAANDRPHLNDLAKDAD